MWFVWLGVILVLLKVLDVGPMVELSWWWTLAPFGAALVWFEWLEKLFGRDRRKVEHLEWEQRRKERVAQQFGGPRGDGRTR